MARSLGERGITVYALADRPQRPVRASRHCHEFRALGPAGEVQSRWLAWLEQGPRGAVVLPCDDEGVELVARCRARLVELGYVPIEADDEVLLAMLDKDRTNELARAAGVDTPTSLTIRDHADLAVAIESLAFPSALKPLHSHHFQRSFGNVKAVTVHSRAELETTMQQLLALGLEMMATEFIPGPEHSYYGYYSYLDEHGEPLFHLTKQKLRQHPPGFGMGSYHVTRNEPEVAEIGLRFLQGVGVRGLANVEFKRDARDGRLKLIECNHRFTAIDELLRFAGADLAWFTYNRLLGRPVPSVEGYRSERRLLYAIEDFRTCRELRRSGRLSYGQWAASLLHRQHFPLFSLRDPRPSIASLLWLAGRVLGRMGRAMPESRAALSAPAPPRV